MMKKYLNLKNQVLNLQITRYKTMCIPIGIGSYDSKIADKFPSILQPVKEDIVVKKEEEEVINEVNYTSLSYKELKEMVKEMGVEISGRKTSRNMIIALEAADL